MSSADIVILEDVFMQNIIQMSFIENNHMVETFPAKCTDDTFGEWILSWTSWGSWCIFQSKSSYSSLELGAIDAIVITDHIFCGFVESKSFAKLLNCPLRVRL